MATRSIRYLIEARDKASAGFKSAGAAAAQTAMEAGKLSAGLLAVGAAALKMGQDAADARNNLLDMSARTGIAADTLQGLQVAAEGSGESLQGMDRTLRQFVAKVQKSGDATKSMDEQLQAAIRTIQDAETPTLKATKAVELFGTQGGKMVQILGDIPLDEFVDKAREYGIDVGPKAAQASAEWQRTMADLGLVFRGLRDDLFGLFGERGIDMLQAFTRGFLFFGKYAIGILESVAAVAKATADQYGNVIQSVILAGKLLKEGKLQAARGVLVSGANSTGQLAAIQENYRNAFAGTDAIEAARNFQFGAVDAGGLGAGQPAFSFGGSDPIKMVLPSLDKMAKLADKTADGFGALADAGTKLVDALEEEAKRLEKEKTERRQNREAGLMSGDIRATISAVSPGGALAMAGPIGVAVSAALNIDKILGGLEGQLRQLADNIRNLPDMIRGVVDAWQDLQAEMPTLILDLIAEIPHLIADIGHRLIQTLYEIPRRITSWVRDLPERISKQLADGEFLLTFALEFKKALFEMAWFLAVRLPIELIKVAPKLAIEFAKGLFDRLKEIFDNLFRGIKDFVETPFRGREGKVLGTSFKKGERSFLGIRIPALADGGVVTRPTLAMVGEAGPEAVLPLGSRAARHAQGGNVSGPTIHLHIGTVVGDQNGIRDLAEKLRQAIGNNGLGVPAISG